MAIVYIESNTTGFGLALLNVSSQYDEVHFLVRDRARYPLLETVRPGVRVVVCDTSSIEAVAEVVASIGDVRFVASTSDGFIEIAARLSERFGTPGNSPATVARCRDKLILQDVLRNSGVAYPITREIRAECDTRDLVLPFIVKPRQGTGSVGVRLIERLTDFFLPANSTLICQSYVPGVEFSVESFSDHDGHHVLAITRKYVTKPPHFLELAHVLPADLSDAARRRIVDTVTRALEAVGYTFGPAHTELKLHGETATVIEINARLAGGMIPRLLERAYGWSVADLYVRSHLSGRSQFVVPTPALYAAVAFIVPEIGRPYAGVDFPSDSTDAGLFREQGVNAGLYDFSDRAGYTIASGRSARAALRRAISQRLRARVLYIDPPAAPADAATIHNIVYRCDAPPRFGNLTSNLLTIEKAHLLMLRSQRILSAEQFGALRDAVHALEVNPDLLHDHRSGRGDYFDYEHYVISRCGRETGGMIQAARSRNDINATHLVLTLRAVLDDVARRTIDVGDALARRATDTVDTPLPIYSQYQTAMPGTAGHYLAAQGDILLGTLNALVSLRDDLDTSPLGACAGAGTSFATDSNATATLLGFVRGPSNSLSAIADKNAALRGAYLLTELSANLSRIACDLQLLSMREIAIVELPNGMYGGSSNMPQKRNPFLLEWLRMHHDCNLGRFTGALSALSHLPTGNSYQASRTAVETIAELAASLADMLTVLVYAIDGMCFDKIAARRSINVGNACATLAAETLVQRGSAAFRDAHAAVGRAIAGSDGPPDSLECDAAKLLVLFDDELALGRVHERLSGGGGPAVANTLASVAAQRAMLHTARRRQLALAVRVDTVRCDLDRRFREAS